MVFLVNCLLKKNKVHNTFLFLNRKCIADILERFHIGDFVLLICKYYEVRSGVFKNQYWH